MMTRQSASKHYRYSTMVYRIAISFVLALLFISSATTWSQDTAEPTTSMRELLESDHEAERIIQEQQNSDPNDVHVRATPLASALGLRKAIRRSNFAEAGNFLDLRYLPAEVAEYTPEQLVQAPSYVWGLQNILDITALSDDPEGHLDDGLPAYRDLIGWVTISTGKVPIFLQRVPDGQNGKEWELSNATGAVTLYTARPVNPGDFCRFGSTVGTVEDIGLRSTTIRTLNRTLVLIPNSVFSSMEIENHSMRDRIRFFPEAKNHFGSTG